MGNLGNLTMDAMLAKPVASALVGLFAALAGTVWWKTRYEKSTYSLLVNFCTIISLTSVHRLLFIGAFQRCRDPDWRVRLQMQRGPFVGAD